MNNSLIANSPPALADGPISNTLLLKNLLVNKFVFSLLVGIAICLLFPRLNAPAGPISRYLWAEDSSTFLLQAKLLGISSIWQPYAGYLHIYPRLIALIANQFSLIYTPWIFFSGWLVAYTFAFSVIIQRALSLGIKPLSVAGFVLLVSLQPHFGEVYFTLTNAQWCLGTALCIWILSIEEVSLPALFFTIPIWLILGLTGPFSILLIPALLAKVFFRKDFKKNFFVYMLIFGCAAVQLRFTAIQFSTLLHSYNLTAGISTSAPLKEWLKVLIGIGLFDANTPRKIAIAELFWVIWTVFLVNLIRFNYKIRKKDLIINLLLLVTVGVILLLAEYKFKNNPLTLLVLGSGTRFTWICYVLILFGVTLTTKNHYRTQCLLGLLIFIVFHQNLRVYAREDLQFNSYVNFANFKQIKIPFNPQYSEFSLWYLDVSPPSTKNPPALKSYQLDLTRLYSPNIIINQTSDRKIELHWKTNAPKLLYSDKINCDKAKDIGMEVQIDRSNSGLMKLFWSNSTTFNPANSLALEFLGGSLIAHYAFPYDPQGNYIQLMPGVVPGSAVIKNITVYCLPPGLPQS